LQLDSLADVVSFGVAPSMIIYQFLRLSYAADEDGLNINSAWLYIAFVLAAAGAYRLARYNITHTQQTKNFIGVPIPAVGLVVASFPVIYWFSSSDLVLNILLNKWMLYLIIIIFSYLLVCKIPMLNLKFEGISFAANKSRYILLIVGVLCAIFLQWLAVPIIFLVYIILSLAFLKN
jgi:CDP-diacylglycerol--serine O-phosphatidyltransferase